MWEGSVVAPRKAGPSLGNFRQLPGIRMWGPAVLAILGALLGGPLVTGVPIIFVVAGVAASALVLAVTLYPPLAAFALLGLTPLLAGIDRGSLIPVLRPSEALDLVLGIGLLGAVLIGTSVRRELSPAALRVSHSILIMAVVSSVVPLLWMVVRGVTITQDDLLYALTIWKYYGIYLLIRRSVASEGDVRRCLWISMIAAALVGIIAILQSLGLFGVSNLLATYYNNFGNTGALVLGRGSSTLALPIAVADLMIFNLAIAAGLLLRGSNHRKALVILVVILAAGTFGAGEFSGVLGLGLGAVAIAFISGRVAPILALTPVALGAATFLRSVIQKRLIGFSNSAGWPISWVTRLANLRTYFWPQLSSHYNFILGLRPTARVPVASQITGFVWIESGYTWLLWAGGIPFLLSFIYFVFNGVRVMNDNARRHRDAIGAAATASLVGLVVVGVLMILDPHLTYRGSADLLFSLLALGAWGGSRSHPAAMKEASYPPIVRPPDLLHEVARRQTRPVPKVRSEVPSSGFQPQLAIPRKRLRFLVIVESLPLGSDHRLKKQVHSLLEAGHEVSVICRRSSYNDPYRNRASLRLIEHPAPPQLPGKLGFFVEYSFSAVMATLMTLFVFVRYGFDVIQVCCPPDIYFPLGLPFKLLGRRFVVDQRDLSPEVFMDRFEGEKNLLLMMLRRLEWLSFRCADHIICVNDSLRRIITERGGKSDDQVSVVGNGPALAALPKAGVPEALPAAGLPLEVNDGTLLCCWLGVMGPQDHVDLVLRVVEELVHRRGRRDCHFVLIGAGESLGDLKAMSLALELSPWVTFTGWLEEDMVNRYLLETDVGIDTNLQEEVTPVKGLEYMAFRIPFVAFDLPETKVMAEGAAAYAASGDVGAMADRLAELLDEPDRRSRMGAVGRARIERNLSWERQRERYLAVYEGLR